VAVVSLSLMILVQSLFGILSIDPFILIGAVLGGILLYGIITGRRWAYFLTFIAVFLGTVSAFSKSAQVGFVVLILDCLVLVPVARCTDYFFPKEVVDA
ncbi:MAG: hypothetical protein ABIK28_13335, partial [Planctomycetota bacterium]